MGNSLYGKRMNHQAMNGTCNRKDIGMARKEFELLAFGFQSCISKESTSSAAPLGNNTGRKTLQLPCKTMIREIRSGGNFTIFRTFSNKLFIKHIGEAKRQHETCLSGKINRFKYQKLNRKTKHKDHTWGDKLVRLNYSKKMKNTELAEVYCSNHSICLRMNDDSIAIFDDYSKSVLQFNDYKNRSDLKFIFSGPLASTLVFVNTNNQVDLCQHKENDLTLKNYEPFTIKRNVCITANMERSEIIKGVCGAEKSFLIIEDLIDGTHQIYLYNERIQQFDILTTPFQGERVQDISCGYRHMALILECGDFFISNSSNDISFKLVHFPLFPFVKLNEPPKRRSNPNRKQEVSKDPYALIYERDQYEGTVMPFIPKKVQCSSLATFIFNEKGCIILGQPCNDVTPTFLFDDGSSAFYHSFDEDAIVPNSEISVGGWHFSFHQTRLISKCSLQYFQYNLKRLTHGITFNRLNDITVISQ